MIPHLPIPVQPEPSYVCEVPECGKVTSAPNTYSISVSYCKPGPGIAAFQCEGTQHFACSPEHAVQAAQLCLLLHILPAHETQHQGEGLPPVADRALLAQHMGAWFKESYSKSAGSPA